MAANTRAPRPTVTHAPSQVYILSYRHVLSYRQRRPSINIFSAIDADGLLPDWLSSRLKLACLSSSLSLTHTTTKQKPHSAQQLRQTDHERQHHQTRRKAVLPRHKGLADRRGRVLRTRQLLVYREQEHWRKAEDLLLLRGGRRLGGTTRLPLLLVVLLYCR